MYGRWMSLHLVGLPVCMHSVILLLQICSSVVCLSCAGIISKWMHISSNSPSGKDMTTFWWLAPLQNFRRGTPSVGKFAIFDRDRRLSRKRYEIGPWLLWIINRKSYVILCSRSISVGSNDLEWPWKARREGSNVSGGSPLITLVRFNTEWPNLTRWRRWWRSVFLRGQLPKGAGPQLPPNFWDSSTCAATVWPRATTWGGACFQGQPRHHPKGVGISVSQNFRETRTQYEKQQPNFAWWSN